MEEVSTEEELRGGEGRERDREGGSASVGSACRVTVVGSDPSVEDEGARSVDDAGAGGDRARGRLPGRLSAGRPGSLVGLQEKGKDGGGGGQSNSEEGEEGEQAGGGG